MNDSLAARRPRVVPKPWGEERVFAEESRYAGKLILIRSGEALSLQYHLRKDETIHVLEGTLGLLVERDGDRKDLRLSPGEAFHVAPGTRHRLYAPAGDVLLVEVSSPELDDVVRLEDRYGREGTSAP
jgi:mannose-6-phosphate isomerase-like protein (cupin superfamily)